MRGNTLDMVGLCIIFSVINIFKNWDTDFFLGMITAF